MQIKCGLFSKKYSTLCYTLYIYSSLLPSWIHQHIRNTDKNQYDKPGRRKIWRKPKRSIHRRDVRQTDGQQGNTQPPPAPSRRTLPTPGHISPPDGVPGGHVPRSEARGFHRESGKNPLFQFQIIRLLFSFGGNTKKGNRIPSDCLYILYVLSFLHTFPFSIFAKNKKSMKKRKLICTIVGIILGAPLGLVIGYILRKYILLLLQ